MVQAQAWLGLPRGTARGATGMLRLIAVGRLRQGPEADLFARYNARLRPQLAVTEIAEGRGAAAVVKRREALGLGNRIA